MQVCDTLIRQIYKYNHRLDHSFQAIILAVDVTNRGYLDTGVCKVVEISYL